MVFVPMAQAPPKAGAKELYSLNLIHELTSLFSPKVIFAGLPGKAFPRKHAFVDISVFLWLRKQRPRFTQGQPKGYFQTKELHRTTQAIAQMNADWKVEEGHYAEFNVPTCGKIAVWLLCKETQPLWNSHDSWLPELNMFGSMPWCSFPCHKLLPSLAQKTCFTVSLNAIHEFTSLFSPKVISAGLPGKAFPRNQVLVDISVFLRLRKQRPRFTQGQPKGYFQTKELHKTTQAIAQMNADWKVEKGHYAEVNVPTCGKIAVWLLCRETQPLWNSHDSWWPELNMFGSMAWCSLPWHKLLARLVQTNCRIQVCSGRPSHGSMPL